MEERVEVQQIPVKVYRTAERLSVAAPMPGLGPEDITVEVTADGYLVLNGKLRGALKGDKDLLASEWSVGPYRRNLALPVAVDGRAATITYGNGVLVVALPVAAETRPAFITLERVGRARGEGRSPDRDAA
ncbi:MAG TPA: Hsp20/alpha crystallin family protein [Methylomirabilota bacterium]|jgi:HSP20 family protein|nr:Hsp20/alpha crystallin family protein [Methylomirabilota bacterium]